MSKVFNALCLLSIIVAAVVLYKGNSRRVFAESEVNRLSKRFGELNFENKNEFHVVCVSEDRPKSFFWRVHMPELATGLSKRSKSVSGSSFSTGGLKEESCEYTVVFRYRVVDEKPSFYISARSDSSLLNFPEKLLPFLRDHWEELEFKVLGDDGSVSVPKNQLVCFLEIRIPENLLDEVPESYRERLRTEPLYRYAHGTEAAFNASNDW